MRPSERRRIRREHEPLQDGQRTLEVKVIRRVGVQNPITTVVSEPRKLRASVQSAFGADTPALTDTKPYIEKHIHTEIERFRWMKPDGKGGLIPR